MKENNQNFCLQVRKYGKLIHKLRSRLSLAQAEAERFKLEKVREYESSYTVKKVEDFSISSWDVTYPIFYLAGNNFIIPSQGEFG